jgi:hypothetical protein
MQFVAPDILAEGRGLSLVFSISGLSVGFLLWVFGWWGHRFWIVLTATLVAGVWGLACCPVPSVPPLVVSLLLAVAAGALGLALVRVVIFAAGGIAVWLAAQSLSPDWNEPIVCMLAGGLVGLMLFRFWTMLLTSTVGTVLMTYSALLLFDKMGKIDSTIFAERNVAVLNWSVGGMVLLGWTVQFLMERWRIRNQKRREEAERAEKERHREAERQKKEKEKEAAERAKHHTPRGWWPWSQKKPGRKAG